MDRADVYRANAEHCRRMAERTVNEADKRQWLQLAQSWLSMLPSESANGSRHRAHPTVQQQQQQPQGRN